MADRTGHPTDLSGLTRDNVLSWLESLRQRKLNDSTILTRWRGLRRFITWLLAEQIIHTDPLAGLTVDKPEAPPVPVLADEELTALLNVCKGRNFNDFRDTAMIRLLIDCGLRVSELTGIDLKHLDLDTGTVQVTGKGSRVRAAYFGSRTAVETKDLFGHGDCLCGSHATVRTGDLLSQAENAGSIFVIGPDELPTGPRGVL